ncbi:MAG: YcbK family protein [Pseudomonadota bacterium]|uniref:Murein endopeptidase K n=1 Tax=Caldimonas aquatica TaxID=376175 RepID=A0ABY6MSR2_9BURK|nr:YcbK family protein [Schlegelella aquatica]UZD55051.1 DUF882 domain-containing protein [Schlegelella aquatica]
MAVTPPTRRRFLLQAGACAAAAALPLAARARADAPRALQFLHLHTGERLSVEYFDAGRYLPDALEAVNRLLRDFRTDDVHPIDPELLDVLHRVATLTGTQRPFEIISGYRSPRTNAALRERSDGVATRSLHMDGRAIDVRLGDVALPQLRAAALALRAGGVGYYPASNFVHLDTGRVRFW